MRRLIDVNALSKDLELLAKHEDSFRQSVILGVVHTVKAQPTVDAVEVVRCKDCKHFMQNEVFNTNFGDCFLCGIGSVHIKKADDFCSYGERKDNERKAD